MELNTFKAMQIKMAATKGLVYKVSKKKPELISPAESTPYEIKYLSDIDDQKGLRGHIPMINFYQKKNSMEGKDPVNVIRDAIAKALVFYYPLAGRLREFTAGKLAVECTGEGVVFVEADADVMLQHLVDDDDALYPPFPNLEDLLDVQGFNQITNSPLLFFQVTRLLCGGFILAYIINHTMCDGAGTYQFMSAVGELARGATAPSVTPVWQRHLLTARRPPQVSFAHREYDVVPQSDATTDKIVQRSFLFTAADIAALRRSLPPHLQSCSRFEVVAGCVWRCRTIALSPKPDEEIRFACAVDIRKRMSPPLPVGYYGNVIGLPTAVTTAGELSENPLGYAVELVRKAKDEASGEYLRSVADLMVMRGRPSWTWTAWGTYMVSDLTHRGFEQVDVGWGTAAYGGVARGFHGGPINSATWYIPLAFNNKKKRRSRESGTLVPLCLPLSSMEVFVQQLNIIITAATVTSASAL